MNEPKSRFTGIFIPKEILEFEELTLLEIILLSWIDALYDEDFGGCYASNSYLGEKIKGAQENTIAKSISKLRKLKLIEDVSFDGRKRVIRSLVHQYVDRAQSKAGLDKNPIPIGQKSNPELDKNPKGIPPQLYSDSKGENKEREDAASEQARDAVRTPVESTVKNEENQEDKKNLQHNVYYPSSAGNYKKQKSKKLIKKEGDNLENETKIAFGDYVKLRKGEYEQLCDEIGKETVDHYIKAINNHIPNSKRGEYKCYKSAIRKWDLEDKRYGKKITFSESKENEKLAQEIYSKYRPILQNKIEKGNGYLEFNEGTFCVHLKFDDKDFKSKLEKELPRWVKSKKRIA